MATASPIRLCPDCSGTGNIHGKIRFLAGTRLPDVAGKPPDECKTCQGDGYVYVHSQQHP